MIVILLQQFIIMRVIWLVFLIGVTLSANATLSLVPNIYNLTNPLLFLNFSVATTKPSFQLFTNSAQINFTIISPTTGPMKSFTIRSAVGLVAQQVTLIFNNPQSVCNGTLTLSSYILTISVLQAGVAVVHWSFVIYTIVMLSLCLYGKAGLMLVEFTQITLIANNMTMIFQSLRKEMYKGFFFVWGGPWFSSLSSNCFLNNALVIMIFLAIGVIAAAIVRFVLGQGAGRYHRTKYFFNYNFLILIISVTYLPLCVSIVFDFVDLIQGGTPVSVLMVFNHIICGIFTVIVLGGVYYVGRLVNYKYDEANPSFYLCYAKLFTELQLKHWYRRNEKLFQMIKLGVIAVGFYWKTHIFYIVMIEALEMFLIFTIYPYKSNLYNRFRVITSITILAQYIMISVGVMFQFMSSTLMQFEGTVKLDVTCMGMFAGNTAAFVGLSVYEAVVRIKGWNCGKKSTEDEDEPYQIEMIETNRQAKQSIVTDERGDVDEEKVS